VLSQNCKGFLTYTLVWADFCWIGPLTRFVAFEYSLVVLENPYKTFFLTLVLENVKARVLLCK